MMAIGTLHNMNMIELEVNEFVLFEPDCEGKHVYVGSHHNLPTVTLMWNKPFHITRCVVLKIRRFRDKV